MNDTHIKYCLKHIIGNPIYMNISKVLKMSFMRFIIKDYDPVVTNFMTIYISENYHLMEFSNSVYIHDIAADKLIVYSRIDNKKELLLFTHPIYQYFDEVIMDKHIIDNAILDTSPHQQFNDNDCANLAKLLNFSCYLLDEPNKNKWEPVVDKGECHLHWEGEKCHIGVYLDVIVIYTPEEGKRLFTRSTTNNMLEHLLFFNRNRYRHIKHDIEEKRFFIVSNLVNTEVRGITLTIAPVNIIKSCPSERDYLLDKR
jgi:hypothetical protein